MSELKIVGRSFRRVDALEKVLGSAKYTHDLQIPGMLWAKVLRSTVPHAEIVTLDVKPALQVTGVRAAITAEDFADHGNLGFPVKDEYVLAHRKVRYVGEPIAAVAADTAEAAEAGLAAIRLLLRPLPAVFQVRDALKPDAPILHDELVESEATTATGTQALSRGGNVCDRHQVRLGDPAACLAQCDVTLDQFYSVSHQEHAYLETEAALAVPTPNGGVTVYVGDQSPFVTHGNLLMTLGLRPDQVRVMQARVGGAFGGKSDMVYQCAAQVAKLALKSGLPVKLVTSREESMTASYKREAMQSHYLLGADRDGTLRAAKVDLWSDSGAYASQTPLTDFRASIHAMGPYRYTDCHVDATGVYTNNGYSGAFRGFGNPEITAASEQAIDELAGKCGIDPLDFRLKNCVVRGDTLVFGQTLEHSVGLRACLERVRALSDWDRRRAEYGTQATRQERRRGIGVACFFHGTCLGNEGLDWAVHTLRAEVDGTFCILTGLTDYGQGSHTTFGMLAAETMGLPIHRFCVHRLDTDAVHDCGPTVASRSTIVGGNATRLAALKLLATLQMAAAIRLGCAGSAVRQEGEAFVGPDGARVSLDDVIAAARNLGFPLSETARWEMPETHWSPAKGRGTPYAAYHFGAQVADVLVDRRTGQVTVEHIWAVHDVGRVISPEGARGQVIGGLAQGLGYALLERVDFDHGTVLNPNFDTYLIPTIADVPPVTVEFVEEELPFGPFGAKNVAEPPMVATAPAIANAIYHAVGRRLRHLPANLERVLLGHDLLDLPDEALEGDLDEPSGCKRGAVASASGLRTTTEAGTDGDPSVAVSLRYGGMLADRLGRSEEVIELPAGATLGDLQQRVLRLHSELVTASGVPEDGLVVPCTWLYENRSAEPGQLLASGAQVLMLPMMGGGG